MSRRSIDQLGENEAIQEVYIASSKQLRPNRQGNLYLQLQLSDKTGNVNAMMWNATEAVYTKFNDGDYVRIKGNSQFYNGAMQIIVNHIEKVEATEVDEDEFVQLATAQVDRLQAELAQTLRGMKNVHLRSLAECFLIDEAFMDQFRRAPAGVKQHHAYSGGLLEHVVNLMQICAAVVPFYPEIDPELLAFGAFVHDLGKIDELNFDRGFSYSDEGQLVGHLVMGVALVEQKIAEAEKLSGEPFPHDLAIRIKHMVVSHHGKLEFGSPKVPMTLEALALHYLDSLDAHLHGFAKILADDVNPDSHWTIFNTQIGRKLYKGPQPE